MSSQSAKKKRIGSRRRVGNQSKPPEADEFDVTDSTSIAQRDIPEERTESLYVLANPDSAQSETQNAPSPELTGNRRKLGSSRRNKGGQHVKDSATESYHKPRGEVGGKTMGYEILETTQMLQEIQPERQEELNQGSERDIISATHDSSFYSATTPDYSSEVQSYSTTNRKEADLESLIPKSENLQADQDENEAVCEVASDSCKLEENMLGGIDRSDTLQSKEVKENAHLFADSELTSLSVLSCPTMDQQPLDQSILREMPEEELPNVCSVTKKESKERDENTMFLRPDGNLQGSYVVSESHVESFIQIYTTPEIPTNEKSPREDTEIECHVEQEEYSSSKEELSINEKRNEIFNLSEVRGARHSEDVVNKMCEQEVKQTEIQEIESVGQDATENSEIISGNLMEQAEVSDIYQPEVIVKSTDDSVTKQEDPEENNLSSSEQTDHQEKEVILSEDDKSGSSLQTLQSETNAPLQTDTGFHPIGNRRKIGSSRRNKGRQQVKESVTETYQEHNEEVVESTRGNGTLETTQLLLAIERTSQEEFSQGSEHDIIMHATHDKKVHEEVKEAHHSEDAVNKVREQEVQPTQMQEIDYSAESLTHDATEDSEIIAGNLMDQAEVSDTYQSDLIVKSTDDSVPKQEDSNFDDKHDEHTTEENNFEALHHRNEDDHVYDTKEPMISDIERVDTALDLVYEIEGRVEHDIKPSAEQTLHQEKEGILSKDDKSRSSLQTLQSETNASLDSETQQTDTGFHPIGNRRKIGSSRRNKGRQQVKESVTETYHEQKEVEESTRGSDETKQMLLAIEQTSQEQSSQGSEHDIIMPATHDNSLYSATMPGYSSEVQDPSTTNYPEADPESLIPKRENIQEDHDESETDFKVEVSDKSVVVTLEGTDKSDILRSQEVRDAHHSEDAVNKVHEDEAQPTQMQEINFSSESVTHDATEDSEITSGNLMDQAEVGDTYQSDLIVKSTDDSVPKQEDSNFDDKHDEHATEENSFEALDHRNEDDHVYDTKEPLISDIERVDTAQDLVYEIEGRVEHDIKPSAEQTLHQEKEGILSEDDKSRSSLQTLQSETNAPLQTDTGFHPIGNRRKIGSSRRNKGRQQVKESVTETYHEQKEVEESTRGSDETKQMLLAIERTSQEQLSQGSEHDIIMPATHDNSLYSATMPGYSSEVQDPSTTNYPEADLESLIPKRENIQEDHDESETDFKVEVSDKSVVVTLEGTVKSDTLQSQEVRDAHLSEDAVNKVHEDEVQPTQMQEIDFSSESVTHDATEDSEITSGNLMDQAEVSDTYQSDLIVKSSDDSVPKQEDSNFDDKHDEHATEENSFEALDHRNEDDHVYDTKEPMISDIERVDTAQDLVYEIEGRVEHDIKPSAEQTLNQKKEGIMSEDDKSESTLQMLQSETNASLDSETQQTDTGFHPIRNRRKMGSSRRNKGRQQVKESVTETYHEHKEEVVESTRGNDETTQMLLAIEQTSQEQLSQGSEHDIIMPATHDNSLYSAIMPGYSSEVQDPSTTNYPEADLESLIPKRENIQEDHDESETDFKVDVSDKSVVVTLEGTDKSDTLQSQEVRDAHHSEDAVNKVHEDEVQPTQMQEIDFSSESVTHDATEDSEITSGNLMDQAEVSDTYQSDLIVKSTDDSVPKQEDSNVDDKHDEHATEENSFEALDHRNEDDHVYDTKEPLISDIERVDTAQDLVYDIEGRVEHDIKPSAEQTLNQKKEGILSEDDKSESTLQMLQSETNASLDSETQQTDTGFHPIGNRRKMGSSQRNKGRQQVKESVTETYHEHKEEVVESTRGNDETTQMLLAIEQTSQEQLSQGSEHDIIMPATHDNSLYSATMPGYSSEVQDPSTTNYPEADLESLISKRENIQEDHDESETDFKVEVSDKSVVVMLEGTDKSDTLQSQEVRDAHLSEDAVNKVHEDEVQPTQMQEINFSSESVTHDATEDSEITSGNLMDQAEVSDTYHSDLIVKSTDDSVPKQEDSNVDDKHDEHTTEENSFEALDHRNENDHVYDTKEPMISDIERVDTAQDLVYDIEGRVEHDIKPSAEQTLNQKKEGILSEDDKSESTLQMLQSETNASLDSETQQTDTVFHPIGNRRKMGSSRRNKGRQQVKESVTETYHEHKEEVVESTRGNDETTQMLLAIEQTSQEQLSQGSEHNIIMPATHDNSLYSAIMPGYSSEVQDPSSTNYPEADLESLIPKRENIQEDHDESETDFKVDVSDKSVVVTLEGMDKSDTLQSQEVRDAHHSEDAVNKVHEDEVQPTQMQEIDFSSESVTHDATEDSEITSGNLMDQAEVSDTYQSDLIVKSTDDSVPKQEDSNFDDKHDGHTTEENNFEALHHRNEDDHVYDTKEPMISDIERVDTALDLVYEIEGRVEHDIKPSAEQTLHQEKEGILSEDDKSRSSLQTLQSETNAPLQTDTGFHPIGNRRKMGSSRRNKGRQQVKESVTETYHEHKEEVVESTRGNDETTQMLLAIEQTSQEQLSQGSEHDIIMPATHDNSLYSAIMPGYSSEVQDPSTTNYPEADLESLIPKRENIQEDHDESETDFKVEVSDKSVVVTLEGTDKSDTLQSQEVRDAHLSEDAVNKVHEDEVQPTQMQEIDFSSESVTHDATEDSEITSGNLMDQAEVSDTYQSDLIVKSTDDSVPKQEDSNFDDKHDEHATEENSFEALDHRNEDDHVYDTKEPMISDIERVDTAQDLVYEIEGRVEHDIKPSAEQTLNQKKEGILSEDDKSESTLQMLQSETNASLDSETQQTDTVFHPIGNRRKMGSSRRNKGRQQVKESVTETYHEHKEEVVESTRGNDETTQMLLAIEQTSQEQLSQGSEHDIIMPATHDNSLYSAIMPGYSSEVQDPSSTNYPEADLESLIPKRENIQEDHDESETDFKVEVSDKSVVVTLEGTDKSDTLQSQEVRDAHLSEDAVNKVHEDEVQPTQMQEIDFSSESVTHDATEDSEITSGNLMDQAEVSDTYQSDLIVKNRRKMGSSRRKKGRQQGKESVTETYHEHKEESEESTRVNDTLETAQPLLAIERTSQEEFSQGSEHDIMMSATHDNSLYSLIVPGYSSQVQEPSTGNNPEADLECLIIESENIQGMDKSDTFPSQEVRGAHHSQDAVSKMHEEEVKPVEMQEINNSSESLTHGVTKDSEIIAGNLVDQAEVSDTYESENNFEALDYRNEHDHVYDTKKPMISDIERVDTALDLVYEGEGREQTVHQGKEGMLQSETNTPLDSAPQQTRTGFYPIGNRRKMGSSRRNKGRQQVQEYATETYHEQNEEVVESTRGNDTLETTQPLLAIERTSQEEFSQGSEHDIIMSATHDKKVHEEVKGAPHSEDAVNEEHKQEVQPTQMQEISDTYQSENNLEALAHGNEDDHVYDTKKPQISDNERVDTALDQVHEIEGRLEDDIKPNAEPTVHQEKEEILSEMGESSVQTLQSEIHSPLDSQPQQIHTGFNPIGNRRKLGSSRRNKGRQHAGDSVADSYHRSAEEGLGNNRDNEPFETTKMSITVETAEQEKSMETTLEGVDALDTHRNDGVSDQVKENAHVGTLVGISESTDLTLHTSPTVDQDMMDQSNFREMPEEVHSNVHNHLMSESHLKLVGLEDLLEDIGSSITPEMSTETNKPGEHAEIQCSVEQAAITSPKEESSTNEEQKEHVNLCQVIEARHSEDAVNEVHKEEVKPTHLQDMHQIDFPSVTESETLDSQILDDSQSIEQQTHTRFNPTGSKRKMGSSRRNKGRQHVMDEFVENVRGDEALVTTEMPLAMEKLRQEELKEKTTLYVKPAERIRKIRSTGNDEENTEKMSNKDVSDEEKKLIKQPEKLTGDDTVSVWKDDSDIKNISSLNTGITYETTQSTQNDEEKPESDQEQNVSHVITNAEQFSAADNKTDTLAHIGLEENVKVQSATDMPEESGFSSQQGIQEKTHLDDSENLPEKSMQKRRKMGSTRRTLNRKPEKGMDNKDDTKESDFNMEADMRNLNKMEVVEELPMVVTAEVYQTEDAKPSLSLVYKEQHETNETSAVHDKGQKLQISTEDFVNPIKFVQVADVRDSERTVDVSQEPLHLDDFTGNEIHKTSVLTETNSGSVNPLRSSNTEDTSNTGIAQSTQNDEERPGAHNKDLEMKNESPNLNSTSKRRKMGSTRRNLGSRTKGEHLHQKQEVDNEAAETATNFGDVKTESFSDIKEKELQLEDRDSDSVQRREKVFETVEYSHTGESHFKPPAHETFEENPVPHGQQVETEHQLTPSYVPAIPSTSPTHDVMSESASGGRRRKMGSHRKSRGHQNNENQTARSMPDESVIETAEEKSLGLDKISEVDESDKKASSNIGTSKAGERPRRAGEKTPEPVTPVQHRFAEIRLGQESPKTFSLGHSRGADPRFNVVMIGDSSVGKTSFMKRAQSGKFCLDVPASIGLDSCVWNVVVDGKPVVLQIWDTAGQERFHSITRQIFHKAQAFLLMYDITSSQSFSAISYWASCIQEGATENVITVLLGNKSDHAERQVKTQEGESLAQEYNFEFMECSAATGENVIQCLETVARMLSHKVDTREEPLVLKKESKQKKSSGCC